MVYSGALHRAPHTKKMPFRRLSRTLRCSKKYWAMASAAAVFTAEKQMPNASGRRLGSARMR